MLLPHLLLRCLSPTTMMGTSTTKKDAPTVDPSPTGVADVADNEVQQQVPRMIERYRPLLLLPLPPPPPPPF